MVALIKYPVIYLGYRGMAGIASPSLIFTGIDEHTILECNPD